MIYLHSDKDRTRPWHFDTASAMYGAVEGLQPYRLTSIEEIQAGKFDTLLTQNLFVGSVEFMQEIFGRLNINPNVPINSNRPTLVSTMGDVRRLLPQSGPVFVKPRKIKSFHGGVISEMDIQSLNPVSDDTEVLVCAPFTSQILSEWRCYVHYNRIVDIKCYSGDPWVQPDQYEVEHLASSLKDFPSAFCIDVAVLQAKQFSDNETVVVEFQDMWAIGNYGLPNDLYLRLLRERYFEIVHKRRCYDVIQHGEQPTESSDLVFPEVAPKSALDALKAYIDSPEGIAYGERMRWQQQREHERTEMLRNKTLSLPQEELDALIERFLKWEDKYHEMYYMRGIDTSSNIFNSVFDLFKLEGKDRTNLEEDEHGFLSCCFELRGWKASLFQGQGSFIRIEKL